MESKAAAGNVPTRRKRAYDIRRHPETLRTCMLIIGIDG
jgi:hypothetical protein